VAWDVEWHKRWAIPAACLLFGPLAIGLNGLWKRPRPAIAVGLAFAATFFLYVALRFGEQAALYGRLGPLPAIWAGDALLALVTIGLLARRPPLPESAAIPA
jgi:lipopolysaccharide export LptBFGC system permease protein LptF